MEDVEIVTGSSLEHGGCNDILDCHGSLFSQTVSYHVV